VIVEIIREDPNGLFRISTLKSGLRGSQRSGGLLLTLRCGSFVLRTDIPWQQEEKQGNTGECGVTSPNFVAWHGNHLSGPLNPSVPNSQLQIVSRFVSTAKLTSFQGLPGYPANFRSAARWRLRLL
jgi:hypothetical protein